MTLEHSLKKKSYKLYCVQIQKSVIAVNVWQSSEKTYFQRNQKTNNC